MCRKGLTDLGYVDAAFTWSLGTNTSSRRAARLNRALCDDSWRCLFQSARVKYLPHSHSDHCPLLLEMEEGGSGSLGLRPFRFEAAWTKNLEFDDLIKMNGGRDTSLPEALKNLSDKLRAWNISTFGNIFKRKKRNEL